MSQSSSSHLLCIYTHFCVLFACNPSHPPRSLTTVACPESEAKLRGFPACPPSFEFLKSPPALQRFPAIQTTHMVSFISQDIDSLQNTMAASSSNFCISFLQGRKVVCGLMNANLAWKWKDLNQTYCVDRGNYFDSLGNLILQQPWVSK